jgi:hypothetical protein
MFCRESLTLSIKVSGREEVVSKDMLYPCPVCGFEVFPDPPGSYDFYPICGWEDDEVQLRFPAMRGGANKASLFECQQHLLRR